MKLKFELKFPGRKSWNGKWSGDGQEHFVVKKVKKENALNIIDKSPYYHEFREGGWLAEISVTEHKSKQKPTGVRGYDWMVDQIIQLGRIKTVKERDQERN